MHLLEVKHHNISETLNENYKRLASNIVHSLPFLATRKGSGDSGALNQF